MEPLRLAYLDPADLASNQFNWRTHPEAQKAALAESIADVGWAGALLFNETTNRIIDGHARKELFAGKGPVPVLIGRWTEDQEKRILASLDPLAAMATVDTAALDSLLRDIGSSGPAVDAMLAKLATDAGITPPDFQPVGIDEQGRLDEKAKVKCPECGHEF